MPNELDEWFVREVLVHERTLTQYLHRCWSRHDEVHDLRQEVYVRVYEAAARTRPATPRAFMFATARHLMTDRLRRSRVVSIEPVGDFESSNVYLIDEVSPERWCGTRQALRRLVEAPDALPERCRQGGVAAPGRGAVAERRRPAPGHQRKDRGKTPYPGHATDRRPPLRWRRAGACAAGAADRSGRGPGDMADSRKTEHIAAAYGWPGAMPGRGPRRSSRRWTRGWPMDTAHRVALLRLQSAWNEAGRLQALAAGLPEGEVPPRHQWAGWIVAGAREPAVAPAGQDPVTGAPDLRTVAFAPRRASARSSGWQRGLAATVVLAVAVGLGWAGAAGSWAAATRQAMPARWGRCARSCWPTAATPPSAVTAGSRCASTAASAMSRCCAAKRSSTSPMTPAGRSWSRPTATAPWRWARTTRCAAMRTRCGWW